MVDASAPEPLRIEGARALIRARIAASRTRVVVIDDDPTGTQTVHGVRVLLSWPVPVLRSLLSSTDPLFYLCTNSRSLEAGAAARLSVQVGRALRTAARREDMTVALLSRSDSTLRGHFPIEVESLASGLGLEPDGIIIAPAFFEAGRFTAEDVHWVERGGTVVPACETEFARDPTFGFRSRDLRSWVEEKTHGAVKASSVLSLSLDLIRRSGPEGVARRLLEASRGQPVIVNAACYEDLEVTVLGILQAEAAGRRFVYRTAASFAKVRAGMDDRGLLTEAELGVRRGPVLIVVGSYVEATTLQLTRLRESGIAEGVELRTSALESPGRLQRTWRREIETAAGRVSALLASGRCAILYTSRERRETREFLGFGARLMAGLCDVVRRLSAKPGAIVAKGGITSVAVARDALGVRQATVLGQVLPGVPVWRLGAGSRLADVPYVVFPGNVGGPEALAQVVQRLTGSPRPE
ncbi:MAG TPA: four-carbon acid sugar kinase family protein [Spirochaetia bacterium]|nr:four-carbon acid sugar kinase family protein [Spirochaetia bacterium]